jgi:hypothetical protein
VPHEREQQAVGSIEPGAVELAMSKVHELLHLRCSEVLAGDGLGGFAVLRRHACGVQADVFENSHGDAEGKIVAAV